MATDVGDATRHSGTATSDRTRGAPNGLRDGPADCGKALAHPPNDSQREPESAHEWADQAHPHGLDSSTGARDQPLESAADAPGESDDNTGRPAERVTRAPQHGLNRS